VVAGEKRLEACMVWFDRPFLISTCTLSKGLCSARTTHELAMSNNYPSKQYTVIIRPYQSPLAP